MNNNAMFAKAPQMRPPSCSWWLDTENFYANARHEFEDRMRYAVPPNPTAMERPTALQAFHNKSYSRRVGEAQS